MLYLSWDRMSEIERIRKAIRDNDKAAIASINISDVRKATQELADDKVDIWNEDTGFQKPRKRTSYDTFLGLDIIESEGES